MTNSSQEQQGDLILALWLTPNVGAAAIKTLLESGINLDSIPTLKATELRRRFGFTPGQAQGIARRDFLDSAKREREAAAQLGIQLFELTSPHYPKNLREIYNPPPILYCKGALKVEEFFPFAMVGSRKASHYGKRHTQRIVHELAELCPQAVLISGLAYGIDTIAHQSALECGLRTIAVLAGGLSSIYPRENLGLSQRIVADGGALLSELPVYAKPIAAHFPLRNRIISGLSKGVLVIEGTERSGAMITANYAIEHNRDLFALPGAVDQPNSQAPLKLIKSLKAAAMTEAKDIFEG